MKKLLLGCVVCCLAGIGTLARADVWGYVDANGVAHFASSKLDERYELFFRGQAVFGKELTGKPVDSLDLPRAVAVPSTPPKLLAFFEVSTNYKAVRHHLRQAARANDIDYELLKALIAAESGFDPQAVSPKGATGLMQLMPATAQRMGVVGDARQSQMAKLLDPKTNIDAGARYLRMLINLFPQRLDLALAAYNAGEGAVQRAGNRIPNVQETQDYVRTVLQLYAALKPPQVLATKALPASQPDRVRVELPNRALGQAGLIPGRGNMVPPLDKASLPATSSASASTP